MSNAPDLAAQLADAQKEIELLRAELLRVKIGLSDVPPHMRPDED